MRVTTPSKSAPCLSNTCSPSRIPLAGPYNAIFLSSAIRTSKPKALKDLDIATILHLDGFLTLPEVEEKAKENKGKLGDLVGLLSPEAESSSVEATKAETTANGSPAKPT
jgi:hypothetical protein